MLHKCRDISWIWEVEFRIVLQQKKKKLFLKQDVLVDMEACSASRRAEVETVSEQGEMIHIIMILSAFFD